MWLVLLCELTACVVRFAGARLFVPDPTAAGHFVAVVVAVGADFFFHFQSPFARSPGPGLFFWVRLRPALASTGAPAAAPMRGWRFALTEITDCI